MNSFQVAMNARIAVVNRAGAANGSTISRNACARRTVDTGGLPAPTAYRS